jgi:hypothetical protein
MQQKSHVFAMPVSREVPIIDPQNGRRPRSRRRAAWKPAWTAYLGTYRLSLYAEPLWYARLLLAIGLPRAVHIRVRRQGNTMTIDGGRRNTSASYALTIDSIGSR